MAVRELKRIYPLRAANIAGLATFLVYGAICALALPFIVVLFVVGAATEEPGVLGALFLIPMLLVYPIIGGVFGWLFGGLYALIYNLVVRWTGGLLLEFEEGGTTTTLSAPRASSANPPAPGQV